MLPTTHLVSQVFVNLRQTALLSRVHGGGKAEAFNNLPTLGFDPHVILQWSDPSAGQGSHELLVRTAEEAKVQALMSERGIRPTRSMARTRELQHALAFPVYGSDGGLVAMVQLLRTVEQSPFDDDEVYLCDLLAPHVASAFGVKRPAATSLRRTRAPRRCP